MSPTEATPVLMPMPTPSAGRPMQTRSALISCIALCMASAAATARAAWLLLRRGAPQKAMTQSPMYLSMVPSCSRMTCVRRVKMRLSRACNCSGAIVSDRLVKPRMSQNMTVISRASARMVYSSGWLAMRCTSSGGT